MDKRKQEVGERQQDDAERPADRIEDLAPDKDAAAEIKGGRKIGELAGTAEGG